MVSHSVVVEGVPMGTGGAVTPQTRPVLLQMSDEDFPTAFLRDLGAVGRAAPLSSVTTLGTSAQTPVTLFQPVTRVVHLALVQLACESPGAPRLDPARVLSAGLVIRRVPNAGGAPAAAWPWMKNANGQFAWVRRDISQADDDPDPARRRPLQSGQPALDRWLAAQSLANAMAESSTPAFVAAPAVCAAANRTLVYAVIPTASSEANTQQAPAVPQLDSGALAQLVPPLLKAGPHHAPQADQTVTYLYMQDDYARAHNASDFLTFSATLRLLYTTFGAFEPTADGKKLLHELNRYHVTLRRDSRNQNRRMGDFFEDAAAQLIDYDPNSGSPAPQLVMPHAWHIFTEREQGELFQVMLPILQRRGAAASPPEGRFQDATRLYRVRLFFRIRSEQPGCPPCLLWSCYSDPFRIAAWYESAGRVVAPVPLPDPFDRNVMKNAKPTAAFAVPPSLMNAMGGANLTDLSNGKAPAQGGGLQLNWICGFSIPLITICAFFVLNIFLQLLNIVFFWLAFIKICIPFPTPSQNPND